MSWHFLGDTTPRAKKRYRCTLCERAIEIGEVHVARRGIGDDIPMTARMHTRCEALTKELAWDDADWECYDPATFRDMIDEKGTNNG